MLALYMQEPRLNFVFVLLIVLDAVSCCNIVGKSLAWQLRIYDGYRTVRTMLHPLTDRGLKVVGAWLKLPLRALK